MNSKNLKVVGLSYESSSPDHLTFRYYLRLQLQNLRIMLMGSLGDGGFNGGIWGMRPSDSGNRRRNSPNSSSSGSSEVTGKTGGWFPVKPAVTAATLALTGDTIAQVRERWVKSKSLQNQLPSDDSNQDVTWSLLDHNWLRALRMASYGFLLYGPGSYVWYQYLDRCMPKQTAQNIIMKVALNQVILGPCVIAVVFAWNNLWQGKLSELPNKYQKDALPTLLFGFRFWIPVSVINFWAIPLQARVGFMSLNSIFWNFYLSSTISK